MEGLAHLKTFYSIPDFRIGGTYDLDDPSSWESGGTGGVTLESLGEAPLRTACIAVGTPHRDADGYIDNAVLFSPFYSGDAGLMYFYWYRGQAGNDFCGGPVVGPGELIDTERHYVIFLDALGLWGAGKPSDGLGLKFPQYSLLDCVQANYRLLRDHLKVSRVKLATGASMGAIQSYLWALLHPEFVEAIMPMGGVTETDANLRWLFRLMSAAIESDPAWRETGGEYYHLPKERHPSRGVMFGWSILFHSAMSFDHRIQMGWDEVQKEAFAWEPHGKEGATPRPLRPELRRHRPAVPQSGGRIPERNGGASPHPGENPHPARGQRSLGPAAHGPDGPRADRRLEAVHLRAPAGALRPLPGAKHIPRHDPNVPRRLHTDCNRGTTVNNDVFTIFNAALGAVDPYAAVKNHVGRIREICREAGLRKIYVASFGKAAYAMSRALADELPDRIVRGVVVTKYGHVSGVPLPEDIRDSRGGASRARRTGRRRDRKGD